MKKAALIIIGIILLLLVLLMIRRHRLNASSSNGATSPSTPSTSTDTTETSKTAVKSGDYSFTFNQGSLQRKYLVHIPAGYDAMKKYPVLFHFHGGIGTIASAAASTGFTPLSDKNGFILIYGQGTTGKLGLTSWNAGNCCGQSASNDVDDVGYAREVMKQVKEKYNVDEARVYMSGMSNGSMLVNRLACEAADLFAGGATVSGTIQVSACTPSKPIAMLSMHGTADKQVPYNGGHGGTFSSSSIFPAEEQATADWAKRNGCTGAPTVTSLPSATNDGFTIDKIEYHGCSAPTVLYRVNGAGHTWPGGSSGGNAIESSSPVTSINASETIINFFGI